MMPQTCMPPHAFRGNQFLNLTRVISERERMTILLVAILLCHLTDSLYGNGAKVRESHGKLSVLAGTTGAAVLGQRLKGTPFNGKIAEVLVWKRVLSATEMNAINRYLKEKYGIH
jgi:hypothetical protein